MPRMNWKDQGRGMEPVEEGTYEVQIKDYKFGESLNGNPKIDFEAVVIGPEGNPYIGRHLWEVVTLVEKAMWRLGWLVAELGIDTSTLKEMDTKSEEFKRVLLACKGRRVWWVVVIDTFNGNKRNKVVDYARSEDQKPLTAMDLEEVPEFLRLKEGGEEVAPF